MTGSSNLLAVLLGLGALLAAEAKAYPLPGSCYLTEQERVRAGETMRWMLFDGSPQSYSNIGGCAVVEIEVSPDGAVEQARVIRSRLGPSDYVWTSVSMRQRYVARGVRWKGLVSFRTAKE